MIPKPITWGIAYAASRTLFTFCYVRKALSLFLNRIIVASKYAKKKNRQLKRTASGIVIRAITRKLQLLAVTMLLFSSLRSAVQNVGGYNVKANFLYNFTRFINWPAEAFIAPDSPFVIGILGIDPFGDVIDAAVAGEKVRGHAVIVERFENAGDIKNCNILFISSSEAGKLAAILPVLNKNVLTVSDLPDLISSGGIIRFTRQKNKIGLQINLAASRAADLTISSKLLQLAEII